MKPPVLTRPADAAPAICASRAALKRATRCDLSHKLHLPIHAMISLVLIEAGGTEHEIVRSIGRRTVTADQAESGT